MRFLFLCPLILFLVACNGASNTDESSSIKSKANLGEMLFQDTNLSLNRSQSCATCHNPTHAFIDSRLDDGTLSHNGQIAAVSLGDDGVSLGTRNSPTASYASFAPVFVANKTHSRPSNVTSATQQSYTGAVGGQFLDGREPDLQGQAGGPFLNLVEMGMPDINSVIERIKENATYIEAFKELYSSDIFDDNNDAYAALTDSIAEFEKTNDFSPFNAKYDQSLVGQYTLNLKELTGKALFFAGNMNCSSCHQLNPLLNQRETFSSYEYHNIGTPTNAAVNAANASTSNDIGLMNNSIFENDSTQKGKFKVPTLRNVAVTEPYMHNGVFRDLKTVVEFYDHFVNPVIRANNPETGLAWGSPNVAENINNTALNDSISLTDYQIEGLVCFLRLLTDSQYQHLVQKKGIDCDA